jgi:hypothetical protein
MEKLQEIELTIKSAEDGVFAVSLVESPAIEKGFVFLSSEVVELKYLQSKVVTLISYGTEVGIGVSVGVKVGIMVLEGKLVNIDKLISVCQSSLKSIDREKRMPY